MIKRLMGQGTFGEFKTFRPTLSPLIWTTVATGKRPDKHGILGWRYPDPADPDVLRFYTSADSETKAFGNILSDYQRRVCIIGWFMSFPAKKSTASWAPRPMPPRRTTLTKNWPSSRAACPHTTRRSGCRRGRRRCWIGRTPSSASGSSANWVTLSDIGNRFAFVPARGSRPAMLCDPETAGGSSRCNVRLDPMLKMRKNEIGCEQ